MDTFFFFEHSKHKDGVRRRGLSMFKSTEITEDVSNLGLDNSQLFI